MRDGITEIGTIIIAVIVLIFVPVVLSYARSQIKIETEAERIIYDTVTEVNCDGVLTRAEMEHILRVAAMQKHSLHMGCYSMEGINNGSFGDYIYGVNEEQLYGILFSKNEIMLPEGGIIGVYR